MLALQGRAQFLLDGQFLATGDNQQPLVGADPLQRHFIVGDHRQGHRQLQAQGLVHACGEGRVVAVATNGQVTEELAFAQGHACVLAALADQAGQVGVMQRRLSLGLGAGVLLVNVDSAHFLPALNSGFDHDARGIRCWRGSRLACECDVELIALFAGKPAPTETSFLARHLLVPGP
ncbi:hypothetical protein D3C81_1680650 [compost metagenome]